MTGKRFALAIAGVLFVASFATMSAHAGPRGGAVAAAKPTKAPTAVPTPGGGFTSRIAFAKLVTTGRGASRTTSLQVIVAWPDGSAPVQVTTTGSNRPHSWSQDGWMAVEDYDSARIRILDVPPGNPAAASEVTSFARPAGARNGRWSAHRDTLGAVLPASQQRLAFREGVVGSNAIVARRHDGSDPVTVASYTSTCQPSQNPGCSGSRYDTYLFGWLPTDSVAGTIRVLYALYEYTYVAGVLTGETVAYRVATLDATSWPATSVTGDAPVLFGGAPVTALNLVASRDGTRVAYDANRGNPNEPFLHVAPLEYNPTTGATTLRSDLAVNRADTSGTAAVIHYAGGFSPDNSQLVLAGLTSVNDLAPSVFVSNASTSGPVVEVDGGTAQADAPIWGP